MHSNNETLRRLERLHVRAWPATETALIDGWLWRHSGGGSRRANSVSTIDHDGTDASASLDRVEALYRAAGAPAQLHTFELTRPASLPDLLAGRGYRETETTVTMLATASAAAPPPDVTVAADPTQDWLDVYLEAITESRRAVNREILRRVPDPRAFFTAWSEGQAISTALCVANGGCAVAECVATRADRRGRRGAERVMRALMTWAVSLGAHNVALQVVENNQPALSLYRRLGFSPVGRNRFWIVNS